MGKIIDAQLHSIGEPTPVGLKLFMDALKSGFEIETVASNGQGQVQYLIVKREEDEEEMEKMAWKS